MYLALACLILASCSESAMDKYVENYSVINSYSDGDVGCTQVRSEDSVILKFAVPLSEECHKASYDRGTPEYQERSIKHNDTHFTGYYTLYRGFCYAFYKDFEAIEITCNKPIGNYPAGASLKNYFDYSSKTVAYWISQGYPKTQTDPTVEFTKKVSELVPDDMSILWHFNLFSLKIARSAEMDSSYIFDITLTEDDGTVLEFKMPLDTYMSGDSSDDIKFLMGNEVK